MPCYHPIQAWRPRKGTRLVFDAAQSCGVSLQVPCGQCIGCRLERSRQWAVRCMHEASLYDDNCFLTLTYAPEFVPAGGSLVKADMQKFFKRMRARVGPFRYFQCGEYGERFGRPHYHSCVFGFDFPDKRLHSENAQGDKLWTSDLLASLWPFGHHLIGSVSFESAAYVARYVTKKVTGDNAKEHYLEVDYSTGEVSENPDGSLKVRVPEYVVMSRRPGIAARWYELYGNEVRVNDSVVARGFEAKPPRFYDTRYELMDPEGFAGTKRRRSERARSRASDATPERLRVRERVKEVQVSFLRRGFETDR